jgi:Ca2+-transporting ATPase
MLALNLKQENLPLLRQGIFSNRFATGWLLGMIVLSLAMTGIPWLHPFLRTTWLPLWVWALVILAIVSATWWIEVAKIVRPVVTRRLAAPQEGQL